MVLNCASENGLSFETRGRENEGSTPRSACSCASVFAVGADPRSAWKLPYEVQTAIPEMRITVHVYGEEPRSRFVMIQHKKYREGDRLSDDLTLDAIAPGGLVLRYQDTAFWMDSQ